MMPILFHFGNYPIYSYPLLMGIGWGMAYNLSVDQWNKSGNNRKTLQIFMLLSFLIGWIGAKSFFLFFSTPDKVLYYAKEINFWLGGGFVFYGGFTFVLIFALGYFRLSKELSLRDLGLLVPGVTLGHAIGRLGCFLAGCCYGSDTESIFGIHSNGHTRYPVQLIEGTGLIIIYIISKKLLKYEKGRENTVSLYLIGYSTLRFFNEFLRGDEIRGIYAGLATSQWISLFVFMMTILVMTRKLKINK